MHMVAKHGLGIDRIHNCLHKITRVRRREAHAANPRDLGGLSKKLGKITPCRGGIPVAVYVLAEQLDLCVASLGKRLRFAQHAFTGPAAFWAPRKRYNAVCARFVAAFDDRNVSSMRIITPCQRGFKRLIRIQTQSGYAPDAGLDLHQHLRQLGIAGRASDQTDVRSSLKNAFPLLLRHAAQYAKDLALSGLAFELLQPAEHFLLSLVADAAGVVKNQFRCFRAVYLLISPGNECADYLFGIVHIHLASEGLNVKLLHFEQPEKTSLAVEKMHDPGNAKQRPHEPGKAIQAVLKALLVCPFRNPPESRSKLRQTAPTFESGPRSFWKLILLARHNLVGVYHRQNIQQAGSNQQLGAIIRTIARVVRRRIAQPDRQKIEEAVTKISYEPAILNDSR